MVDWKDIHEDFTEELKRKWESKGFGYEEVKEWINVGLKPSEAEFVGWLRNQGYTAEWVLNYSDIEELRQEYRRNQREKKRDNKATNLQEWLNEKYPTKKAKEQAKEIIINGSFLVKFPNNTLTKEKARQLDGNELRLSEYPNLETLIIDGNCLKSKIISLDLNNCAKLVTLGCSHNQLTKLDLANCPNLETIWCADNQITDLNIRNCLKIKKLEYRGNPIADDKELNVYKWQIIAHPNFTKELIAEWEKWSFSPEECRDWLAAGLELSEALLARWLERKNYQAKEWWRWSEVTKATLKEEYLTSWEAIHPDFSERESYYPYKTYQQKWEEEGITYQEAKEWIKAKFKPGDHDIFNGLRVKHWKDLNFTPQQAESWLTAEFELNEAEKWKKHNFTAQQARSWVKTGLKPNEHNFAFYLQNKGYSSSNPEIKQVIERESWRIIHSGFDYEKRKHWEENAFSVREVRDWITIGFLPQHYEKIKILKSQGTTASEIREWMIVGLKPSHYEFAIWLKKEGHQPQQAKSNLASLEEEYKLWVWKKELHSDFTKQLINEWEKKGFYYNKGYFSDYDYFFYNNSAEEWVKKGLKPSEARFASYLRYKESGSRWLGWRNEKEKELSIDQLREEYLSSGWLDWTDIHRDFSSRSRKMRNVHIETICQKEWENEGLTYQDAQEWIATGFTPYDDWNVKNWKNFNLTAQEAQSWLQAGLGVWEVELASRLKNTSKAQLWLDWNHPFETRKEIKKLEIKGRLEGSLNLNDFINLEVLDCSNNGLTSLNIGNCDKLKEINCDNNKLTTIFLPKSGKELTKVSLINNQLSDLSIFSHLENLETLLLNGNPFADSLEPLRSLEKLKGLRIEDTNISSNSWEYLSKIKEITLFEKKDNQELQPYRRKNGIYYDYNLQLWRQEQPGFQQLKQTLFKINPSLDINEIINKFEFFNVKTGYFQGDLNNLLFLFKTSTENINFLTRKLTELTNFAKKQRERIVNAYLHFAPEQEMLKKLIQAHLEFAETQKRKLPFLQQLQKKQTIYWELVAKLNNEELMGKVEDIFTDCDKLVEAELELKDKFNLTIESKEGQTIYILGDINVQDGHALIGCQLGDNNNLSYQNNRLIELPQQKQGNPLLTNFQGEAENLTTRVKRQLSISSITELSREENKIIKLDEELEQENQTEPMEIDEINQQAQILHNPYLPKGSKP